jgi:hypothetical protein
LRLKLIGCEVLYRELCAAVSRSVNQVDIEFLPKGLHDKGSAAMLSRLQETLDRVDAAAYEAVLFGYALCGNGLAGLVARSIPLVVPRAHDCITLFLGSRTRYEEYFRTNSGVYFKTSGWIERGQNLEPQLSLALDDLIARYGEENARYLFEELTRHYRRLAFIPMGVEPDDRFEKSAREEAAGRGWDFETVPGDMGLIQRLVDGAWDEAEFLVAPAGSRVVASHDDSIFRAERD